MSKDEKRFVHLNDSDDCFPPPKKARETFSPVSQWVNSAASECSSISSRDWNLTLKVIMTAWTAQQHFFYQFSTLLVIYQTETVPQETEKVSSTIIPTSPLQDYHPDFAYSVIRSAVMSVLLYSRWKWCIRSHPPLSSETHYKQKQHLRLLRLHWLI